MERIIFIDSNIWCYYFNAQAPQHQQAAAFLEEALENNEVYVNTIVLMEVSHYLLKSLGAINGKNAVKQLLKLPVTVIDFDYNAMSNSVELFAEHLHTGICGRDATFIQAMKQRGIQKLATHDQAFKKIQELDVVDPIA